MQIRPRSEVAPAAQPSTEAAREHFDAWNAAWRAGDFDEIDPEIRERGGLLLDQLRTAGLERPRILEVGCGTGWLATRLAGFGPVAGVDLSPRAIAIAQERGVAARFIAGDFLTMDFDGEAFDAIVCVETLFYVSDPERALDHLARLLRPGGWLGLTCINRWVYERSSDIGPPPPGQPRHWMGGRQLRRLLDRHFELRSCRTVHPRGDQGVLRLVNSYKVNRVLDRLFTPGRVRAAKERLGLGGGLVIVARRRAG